ncbi:MAG: hydrogenase iron-sulfur subunit [Anaerolineae bacterium]
MQKIDFSALNPAWEGRRPVIVGFLCNWCSYRAADLAGTSRMGYPATLRDIRIMCTGRLDPVFVLKALREGADGVLVMGCHPGQCHYQEGNYKAMRRMALLRRTLAQLGVHPDRVQLAWASAAQGIIFAEKVLEMTEAVARLGPLQWRDNVEDVPIVTEPLPEEEVAHG